MSKYVLIVPSKLYPTRHIVKTFLKRSRFPFQHSTVTTATNHNRILVEWTSLNETYRRNIKESLFSTKFRVLCWFLL